MQMTFAQAQFSSKKKQTRRDRFLADLQRLVPWSAIEAEIEPFYPNTDGQQGRPAIGLSRMLRMYIMQQALGFSDEGAEDAIYDSQAIQLFMGIDPVLDPVPDATTLSRFRKLLGEHKLTERVFHVINRELAAQNLFLKEGTIVDATIISAPSSTRNKDKKRDPEMHSTQKGNQWYFGMKAHIGVDAATGLVHTLVTTSANHHDVTEAHALLRDEEEDVYGDSGYMGAGTREENLDKKVNWIIAMRRGQRKSLPDTPQGRLTEQLEQLKSSIRAKVEHPFQVLKVRFGYRKARYKGLAKNTAQLYSLFALGNLFLAQRCLTQSAG